MRRLHIAEPDRSIKHIRLLGQKLTAATRDRNRPKADVGVVGVTVKSSPKCTNYTEHRATTVMQERLAPVNLLHQ